MCVQGRFSGRLRSKSDEAALAAECAELGPLLGGTEDGSCGDAARATLSAIVRSIAAGDVRRHLAVQQVPANPPSCTYVRYMRIYIIGSRPPRAPAALDSPYR